MEKPPNKSMKTNRRHVLRPKAEQEVGRVLSIHAPVSAAVGYFCRSLTGVA